MEVSMNKKLLVSVLLCLFILSSVTLAKEEKAKTIEFLAWADTLLDFPYYEYMEPSVSTHFETEPFLRLNVPASPKSEAIFFDLFAKLVVWWSGYETRDVIVFVNVRIISDIIPDNIEVFSNFALGIWETNNSGDTGVYADNRNVKLIMRRDHLDWWSVKYKSGGWVPDEEAISILKKLMDSGFDVEIW